MANIVEDASISADDRANCPATPQRVSHICSFDGNCAEAMRFYERTLGGKLEAMMNGAESPWAEQMPKESGHRILHASLALDGNGYLYAGDAPENMPYKGIKGVALTPNYDTVEQTQRVFNALAEGGKITKALRPAVRVAQFISMILACRRVES